MGTVGCGALERIGPLRPVPVGRYAGGFYKNPEGGNEI